MKQVMKKALDHVHDIYIVQNMSFGISFMGGAYSVKNNDGNETARCAIGHLLGPAHIPEKWNPQLIYSLIARFRDEKGQSQVKERLKQQGFWHDDEEYIMFLSDLQNAHDNCIVYDKRVLKNRLLEVAERYNVEVDWAA